jgi:endonuclease YncB( thermonuclease family)
MNYSYEATLVKVIDGDSLRLKVSLGFNLEGTYDFQLTGLDAPELIGKQARRAKESKASLTEMIRGAHRISVRPTGHTTGAGRWYAAIDVMSADDKGYCVNDQLLALGLAEPKADP